MTIIWTLKDSLSGEYLTKADTLQRLSTTTRTFQKQDKARKVANDYHTYIWVAIKELSYGRRHYRVNISDKKFKDYVYKLFTERRFEPTQVSIHELYA